MFAALLPLLFASQAPLPPPDGCSSIREALARLPDAGGEVVIPAGVYVCRAPIVVERSHVRLRGDGEVTLRLAPGANSPVLVLGDVATPPRPTKAIEVSHLRIDGNRWHQRQECWGGPCDGSGTAVIRNNGITVRGVTRGRILDVHVTGARSGGVVTEKGCFDLVIDGLTAVDNEFDGFAGYETTGARLSRLVLSDNRAAGISLDIRFHGNHFRDVRIERNGDAGIFMRDSSSNVFEDVVISDSGGHGLFLAQADDSSTCPLANEFQNLSVTRSRGFGFRLNDACEGNRLTGSARFLQNRDGCASEAPDARILREGQVTCQD